MFDILGGRKARSDLFPPEKGSIYESDESRAIRATEKKRRNASKCVRPLLKAVSRSEVESKPTSVKASVRGAEEGTVLFTEPKPIVVAVS
jgi:hypothetical protein